MHLPPCLRFAFPAAVFAAAASFGFSQGAAPAAPAAPAATPDGPPTYSGRGAALPPVTANVSNGPTPQQALLVGEKNGGLLTIVDPDSLEVVARVVIGGSPHEVATDGRYAYVSAVQPGAITVVDVKNQVALPPIEVGSLGTFHGLWEAGGKIYIGHENTRTISRYNPETQKIDWQLGVGYGSHMLQITADERTMYLASSGAQLFSVWQSTNPITSSIAMPNANRGAGGGGRGGNRGGAPAEGAPAAAAPAAQPAAAGQAAAAPAAGAPGAGRAAGGAGRAGGAGGRGGGRGGWTVTNFPVTDTRLEGFAISPDSTEMWVLNINERTISIANLAEKKIVETVPLVTGFSNRLVFTPDGKHVLIAELMGTEPKLIIFDAKTRKEVKRLNPGAGGEGIFIDPRPGKNQAFYAVSNGNKMAVIDLTTLTIKKYIEGFRNPDGMAWYVAKPAP